MSVCEIRSIATIYTEYKLMQLALEKWQSSPNLPNSEPTDGYIYTTHSQSATSDPAPTEGSIFTAHSKSVTSRCIAIWDNRHCAILSDNGRIPTFLFKDILSLVEDGDTIVFFSKEDYEHFKSTDIPRNIKLVLEGN